MGFSDDALSGGVRATYLKPAGTPKIEDLPANDATPLEIDVTSAVAIELYSTVGFMYTYAENATDGASRIDSDATRGKFPADSIFARGFAGDSTTKLYIRALDAASTTTDGVSYDLFDSGG